MTIKILAAIFRQRMRPRHKVDINPPSTWQSIFSQSRANGGQSIIEPHKGVGWQFPKGWLEQRREYLREKEKKK